MENIDIEKYCKSVYWFLFREKKKTDWLKVLSWIDKLEQNAEWTKHYVFRVQVYDYMNEQYNLLFKK